MIAILKYNAGNITSVKNAVERLGHQCIITDDPQLLASADKVIFPGVGQAATAMEYLKAKGLDTVIKSLTQPVLGICLGMQLMCNSTSEGNTEGLRIFDIEVKKFPPYNIVPHMGWNTLNMKESKLFKNIPTDAHFYFVHSYYAEMSKYAIAECNYILPYSAVLEKDNFYAVQFHPEKSGMLGEILIKNFLEL
ncbi:imidazole glycerol phosphate synthase subunit HisH [Flavobacterium sp. AG291]|uniref:imidazole glycerol phosphate synthase subunit HisH n=1 Tax=Flavobacterium sp. AG291 TaxID=2184000 RepID=UPI000E0CB462|nr:imidazole glycerol phosphate synthase subunit HisH [Flavobacterium sp. AG291]RDI10486.1 imidazole glycerol phosphate synthase subunit HisH [Flavobacterium sp. AG291]